MSDPTDRSRVPAEKLTPPVTAADDLGIDLESQYRSIFENAVEGIYQTTVDGRYLRVNLALAQIYGYDTPDDLIVGLTDIAGQLYVDPTRRDAFKYALEQHGIVKDFEAQVYRSDGSIIWIAENARCVRGSDDTVRYYEGTVQDITRRKTDEERILLLATVFESVADGILIVDAALTIRAVNPAYEAMTLCPGADLVGRTLDMFAKGFHEESFLPAIWDEVKLNGQWSGEATCWRRTGDPFVASLSFSAVQDQDGRHSHYVIGCSDISVRKQQEQRIWYHANYDLLTQLPNRWLATEQLQQAILRASRQMVGLAVLFLDLNGFKQVNDGLGHHAGDQLLRQVAKRLRACTRLSDVVGRLGGDEFLIVAPEVTSTHAASVLVEKILYTFSDPFRIEEREIYCLPSIGVAFYPNDGETPDTIIRNADVAMYEAKQNKSLRFVTFEQDMQAGSARRLDMGNDLRRALEREELVLHYQPKVDAQSGRVIAAEALIRWNHPIKGLVPPNDFIPLAEECGLITAIGEWTMREGCEQFLRWKSEGMDIGSISINLSPRQFLDPGLTAVVQRILVSTGIDPSWLELELTEGAMSVDAEKAVSTLTSLKELGVKLSIDDFGTGYSSLARLRELPVDVVKIDRSFIQDLESDVTAGRIVEAIIGLADVLGFNVVAEGVETGGQADILRLTQCDQFQGYLISRPLDAAAFSRLLMPAA